MSSEGNTRPVSLLDKILQKCQNISIAQEKSKEKPVVAEIIEEEEEEEVCVDDPGTIVEKICSLDKKRSPASKLKLITLLSDVCQKNPEHYNYVGSSPLVYLAEKLLEDFCKAFNMYNNKLKHLADVPELLLLIPLLKLLAVSANMTIHEIRDIYLYRSQVLLHLMQAAVVCSYKLHVTLKKLRNMVVDKVVVAAMLRMDKREVEAEMTRQLGFEVGTLGLELNGYHVTLYEVDGTKEVDINTTLKMRCTPLCKNLPLDG
ncbi:hypothetical protein L9F63_012838, partial [Diploptera punctata]